MEVNPRWITAIAFFTSDATYHVPKYQRDYRWGQDEITDFCDDIRHAYRQRDAGERIDHFFGGIVTVSKAIDGSATRETKIVDGQQRTTTIALLLDAIRKRYKKLGELAQVAGDEDKAELYESRTRRITKKNLTIEIEKNQKPTTMTKLTLSKADDSVFRDILNGEAEIDVSARESHKRLFEAHKAITKLVEELSPGSYEQASNCLQKLESVLASDLTLIEIGTTTDKEAYKLFQVLNDRGVNLAEGDLLRASTLEALDIDGGDEISRTAANNWDLTLSESTEDTRNYLRWYFTAIQGKAPSRAKLFDEFLEKIFPECNPANYPLSMAEASKIEQKIKELKIYTDALRKLESGEWPYTTKQGVTGWDKARLNMLVKELRHTVAMPLLLAATRRLDAKAFARLVHTIERFAFRYKNLVGAHIGKAQSVYFDHAHKIYHGEIFNENKFREDLNSLINEKADDQLFETYLKQLKYQKKASNRLLKYFLITLEDYWRWYKEDNNNKPKVKETSRSLHMDDTTLEHVYPQNPKAGDIITKLREKVHDLGNITLLGPGDNVEFGNDTFDEKKEKLANTTISMNRWFENKDLSPSLIDDRAEELIILAKKVFRA
ncbi:DUF262 domain-containing protein [Marinobacter sp. F4218]|uniref:DUF262 domain-containing protein n=1 Tax=Marinobacter sp. F4218 TaxID=2862868 RepID=UPI001C639E55|nr:DUF262 domain-containing protein [Marinobacter sp. F4218]MBW7472314.1 DUF262 domain-containing HNH endonuclease family protein [Marinobacter sp. F4218]